MLVWVLEGHLLNVLSVFLKSSVVFRLTTTVMVILETTEFSVAVELKKEVVEFCLFL